MKMHSPSSSTSPCEHDGISICRLLREKLIYLKEILAEFPFLLVCLPANIFTVVSKTYLEPTESWMAAEVYNVLI